MTVNIPKGFPTHLSAAQSPTHIQPVIVIGVAAWGGKLLNGELNVIDVILETTFCLHAMLVRTETRLTPPRERKRSKVFILSLFLSFSFSLSIRAHNPWLWCGRPCSLFRPSHRLFPITGADNKGNDYTQTLTPQASLRLIITDLRYIINVCS